MIRKIKKVDIWDLTMKSVYTFYRQMEEMLSWIEEENEQVHGGDSP